MNDAAIGRRAMSWFSVYGTGATIFSVERAAEGRVEFTVWLSLFWTPLIPISSWSAIHAGETIGAFQRNYFADLVRIPHDGRRLRRTFLGMLLGWLSTVGPLAIVISRTNGRAATTAEIIVAFALTFWTAGLLIYLDHSRKRKLRRD